MATEQEQPASSNKFKLLTYAGLAVPAVAAGVVTAVALLGINSKTSTLNGPPEVGLRSKSGIGNLVRHSAPRTVPDISFADAEGKMRRLSEWRGKFVVLNLWATWCAPCKVEMPALDRLQAQLGGERFAVLAVSTDRTGPKAPAQFFEKAGIKSLALYVDDTAEANVAMKAGGLPLTLLLNADGLEVARLLGTAEWDTPETAVALKTAFGVEFSKVSN